VPPGAIGTGPGIHEPRQALGDLDRAGPRSDVYKALGATLYCLLPGQVPLRRRRGRNILRGRYSGGEVTPARAGQLESSTVAGRRSAHGDGAKTGEGSLRVRAGDLADGLSSGGRPTKGRYLSNGESFASDRMDALGAPATARPPTRCRCCCWVTAASACRVGGPVLSNAKRVQGAEGQNFAKAPPRWTGTAHRQGRGAGLASTCRGSSPAQASFLDAGAGEYYRVHRKKARRRPLRPRLTRGGLVPVG